MASNEPNFDIELDDLDGWNEESDEGGWEDAQMDDEMLEMVEEMEKQRLEFEMEQVEVLEDLENAAAENDDTLRQYVKDHRNPSTVRKTEGDIFRFK